MPPNPTSTPPNPDHPTTHEHWPGFVRWAKVNGVSLEHKDDWEAWWDCYLTGAANQRTKVSSPSLRDAQVLVVSPEKPKKT